MLYVTTNGGQVSHPLPGNAAGRLKGKIVVTPCGVMAWPLDNYTETPLKRICQHPSCRKALQPPATPGEQGE